MTQHLDLDALQAAVEARNLAGAYFAAVAFNWSQQIGHTLTSDDCMMLDKLRREWDAHADSTAYLIDRLRKAEAASKWMPIETAPKGQSIVVGYFNRRGKWRVVRAEYATEEIISEWENDDCEPGWYESSEEQEIIYKLEYDPTHWHPLGAAPTTADSEGAKG